MTKKDYVLLSSWIKANYESLKQPEHKLMIWLMTKELCSLLARDNNRFDHKKFLKACAMPD